MKSFLKKMAAVAAFAAAFALSPSVFASDRFPLPHEILGIPTPHELLGIPAPHEFVLGPDRYSRYDQDVRRYDYRSYDRPYYRSYDRPYYRSYDRRDWRDDREWRYRHHRDDRHRHHHHH